MVEPLPQPRLDTNWLADPTHGGLLVAVTGGLDDVDLPVLRRMHAPPDAALALCLDVDAWLGEGSRGSRGRARWPATAGGPRRWVRATGSTGLAGPRLTSATRAGPVAADAAGAGRDERPRRARPSTCSR